MTVKRAKSARSKSASKSASKSSHKVKPKSTSKAKPKSASKKIARRSEKRVSAGAAGTDYKRAVEERAKQFREAQAMLAKHPELAAPKKENLEIGRIWLGFNEGWGPIG